MTSCLVILKPRQIAVTERALAELPSWYPVIELVGYTEAELAAGVFAEALVAHPHDYYIVASDDLILRWAAVVEIHQALKADRVVTGYCQFTHTDWRVNLVSGPLAGDSPNKDAYTFWHFQDVISGDREQRTWFTGMSLTGMSRQMWSEFPFRCYTDQPGDKGYGSDFHLSKRLQDADVPIYAIRDAFAYHWRHEQAHTNDPRDDRVLVGEVEPGIRYRCA